MSNNELYVHKAVIVRAWGDEPVKLYLYFIDKTHSYVGNGMSEKYIGLPHSQVFFFHNDVYLSLREAFDRGEKDKLSALYSSITVDDFACNKYQDIVKSSHGKENISCIAGIAIGDG